MVLAVCWLQAAERPTIPVNPIGLACSALDSPRDCSVAVNELIKFVIKYDVIDEPVSVLRCIDTIELPVAQYAVLIQSQITGVRRDIERVPWHKLE